MAQISQKGITHNAGIDVVKLAASFFVVFIHVPFPDPVGRVVSCIGRSAVPFFFAFSGFFSYGVDSQRIPGRMRHLLKLLAWGFMLSIGMSCIAIECTPPSMSRYQGSSVGYLKELLIELFTNRQMLADWLLLDVTPVNSALWYLTASIKCYGVLWLYTRFFGEKRPDYQMLYLAGVVLFVVNLLLGVMGSAAEVVCNYVLLRNAVLLGFPMFALGMFLRQYWEDIWENFRLTKKKLLGLILLGIGLSLFEQWSVSISDAHIGSVVIVVASLLLMARYPAPFGNSAAIAKRCAGWSTGIYLVHIPVYEIVSEFFDQPLYDTLVWKAWLLPVCVVLASLALAMLNTMVYDRLKRMGRKTRK